MFDNLKRSFSKRSVNLRKAKRSGTRAADVAAARAALNEYKLLFWLLPHIHYRLTKTNLPVIKRSANEQDDGEGRIEDNDSDDGEEREESDEDESEGNESSQGNSDLKKMDEDFLVTTPLMCFQCNPFFRKTKAKLFNNGKSEMAEKSRSDGYFLRRVKFNESSGKTGVQR